ncbi:unnamed protein product [Bursaphelenchus okinawaensis]|uniref:Autophagy-related protein 9 n=1 Tax=Bursaphelenchus okinawaensis TaxID=465554 RepID=A0A811LAM5_9BILA|nr:unnamed protein product [Bursaphelenchus okinawaensis]CAG9119750.1 unnamed protein product [Bursaphelenchus okinawaensis]
MVIDGEEEEEDSLVQHGYNSQPPQMMYSNSDVVIEDGNRRSFEGSKSQGRWDHIEDIDQFFSLVYEYHRGNGFLCVALKHMFALFQFIFVVSLSTFLFQCVDYDVLFNNKNTTADGTIIYGKRHIDDAVISSCPSHFHPVVVFTLLLATVFWVAYVLRVGYRLLQLFEIQKFYYNVLEIADKDLPNIPWREVVERVCKAQPELHLIVNQEQISVSDIYQRILRYKNYMVGLVDNDVLNLEITLPFMGKVDYLSAGLRLNLEWLFFRGPWAPWKGPYALKDEFRDAEMLSSISAQFEKTIMYIGIANLLLSPFIFVFQLLFSFFSYADIMRRDPAVFGSRKYSNYARLKLRHYNELEHELNYRLNKSYEFAVKYMDQFMSPVAEVVAKAVAFTCGSVFAIIFLLSAWDEDVLNIDHVITVMTATGAIALLCRSFIANENLVLCQNFLMKQVVAHIHYAPSSWIKGGHSTEICSEFSKSFQLKVYFLIEELLSPFITPFILLLKLKPKAGALVHFFHDHSRYVEGVGDVCEYSLMEMPKDESEDQNQDNDLPPTRVLSCGRKRDTVKVELSLLNFVTQHPLWKPSARSKELIKKIKGVWTKEIGIIMDNDNIAQSVNMGGAEKNVISTLLESNKSFYKKSETADESKFAESAAAAMSTSSVVQSIRESQFAPSASNRFVPLNDQVRDEQMRALEMSMNALAMATLLQDKRSISIASANVPHYGANISTDQPSTSEVSQRPTQSQIQSNIWEVADNNSTINESQYDEINEDPEEDDDDHELLPPGGFNV